MAVPLMRRLAVVQDAFAQHQTHLSKMRLMLYKHLMERHQQNDSSTVEAFELSLATEKHGPGAARVCENLGA